MTPMQIDFLETSQHSQTEEKSTILIVDDTPENLSVLGEILQPHYHVKVASSGSRALSVATATPSPDLILLDVMMPGLDGYMVLEHLQAQENTRAIPVLFVTALDASEDEERGLALGAVDYITKPIRPAVVLARVRTHLRLKQASDFLRDQNDFLELEVIRRMRDNQLIQNVSIHALANLAEARDTETSNHIRRTQKYVTVLARKLREHPKYSYRLTPRFIELISRATPLHDIGKVGIPDLVLRKNGYLTPEEFEVMKQHTKIGAEAIDQAMRAACTDQEYQALRVYSSIGPEEVLAEGEREKPLAFLELAKEIAYYHHERWDGMGYPMGLKGEEIPLPARLMAIADVFDGIVSHHVYKKRVSIEESVQLIINGRGSYFDPDLVDSFLGVVEDFRSIAMYYADEQVAQP